MKTIGCILNENKDLRKPIIHGLLRQGEIANLIAPPKSNKTWAVMQLALSVATGRPWLNTFPTHTSKVLMIDNELHEETIGYRFPIVADAMGIDAGEYGHMITVEPMRDRGLKNIDELETWLAAVPKGEYGLIVIDALYRCLTASENSNKGMAQVYGTLDRIARRMDCAIVVVHHTTKGKQKDKATTDIGSGAGAQSRAADAHIVLLRHEVEGVFVLDAVARSWPPIASFAVKFEGAIFRPCEADPAQIVGGMTTPRDFAASFAASTPRSKASIINDAKTGGLTFRLAEALFAEAVAEGYLIKRLRSKYALAPAMLN